MRCDASVQLSAIGSQLLAAGVGLLALPTPDERTVQSRRDPPRHYGCAFPGKSMLTTEARRHGGAPRSKGSSEGLARRLPFGFESTEAAEATERQSRRRLAVDVWLLPLRVPGLQRLSPLVLHTP